MILYKNWSKFLELSQMSMVLNLTLLVNYWIQLKVKSIMIRKLSMSFKSCALKLSRLCLLITMKARTRNNFRQMLRNQFELYWKSCHRKRASKVRKKTLKNSTKFWKTLNQNYWKFWMKIVKKMIVKKILIIF